MTDLDELIAAAELGKAASEFKDSELYKVMVGMAEQEVAAALEDLAVVDPDDSKKIAQLQMNARFGRQFQAWLDELVMNGDEAIAVLKQQQES